MDSQIEITNEQLDSLLMTGDITQIPVAVRPRYLWRLAEKLGLNPLTRPFDFIKTADGKVVVYANRTASDQIRKNEEITTEVVYAGHLLLGHWMELFSPSPPPRDPSVYQVIVKVSSKKTPDRTEFATGCVGIDGLMNEAKANAVMKCWTKATRRGTLSYAGLGFPDESETDSFAARESSTPGQPIRVVPSFDPPSGSGENVSPPTPTPVALPKALPSAKPPVQVR